MENGLITHTYFQKQMKTPYVMMERSAMGVKQRMEILSNETCRRLTNVDHENLDMEEQRIVLEQLTQELKNSGYNCDQAREVITSGYKGWRRRIKRREESGLYRAARDTLEEREKKKLTERETWYIPRSKNEIEEESKDATEIRKIVTGRRRLRNMKKSTGKGEEKEQE